MAGRDVIAGVLLVLATFACAQPGTGSARPGHPVSPPGALAPSPSWMEGVLPSEVTGIICHSVPATCDGATIAQTAHLTDVQQPATWIVRGCDTAGLVLDLSWTGGPACDNACPTLSKSTIRWFYRATPNGWMAITETRTGGCTAVRAADPSFPAALCTSLEPL